MQGILKGSSSPGLAYSCSVSYTHLVIAAISSNGGTPLVVCVNRQVAGVIELQDIIKPGIQERFERLRKMGAVSYTHLYGSVER